MKETQGSYVRSSNLIMILNSWEGAKEEIVPNNQTKIHTLSFTVFFKENNLLSPLADSRFLAINLIILSIITNLGTGKI
jgi:hypothetical protein